MGFYHDQILPRLTHHMMNVGVLHKIRHRVLAAARGTVLEIGFGSGLNVQHYPPAVTRLLIVEPSHVARGLAREAIATAPFPVELVGLDGRHLELADNTVDTVVSTWTLCTIPDAAPALREIARVLRPGGAFLFAEHGLAPDAGVARWQHRLDGIQQRIAGGCHLTRDIAALIRASPLELEALDRFYAKGPRTHAHMYVGEGRRVE